MGSGAGAGGGSGSTVSSTGSSSTPVPDHQAGPVDVGSVEVGVDVVGVVTPTPGTVGATELLATGTTGAARGSHHA